MDIKLSKPSIADSEHRIHAKILYQNRNYHPYPAGITEDELLPDISAQWLRRGLNFIVALLLLIIQQ